MKSLLLSTFTAVFVLVGVRSHSLGLMAGEAPNIPLWQAARMGNIEVVKQHLAAGARVGAKSPRNGSTPLHQAARNGRKEIAELLIAEGADVNAKDHNGKTPLDWVVMLNHIGTTDLLRKHGGKHGVLNGAVRAGDIKSVKELLVAGSDVNAKDPYGLTPLHLSAILNSSVEVAQILISAGSDMNAKDKAGRTPLHYSAGEGHKKFVKLLISKGVDINAKESDERTPLDWAIQFQESETADLLRKHGGRKAEELKAEGK